MRHVPTAVYIDTEVFVRNGLRFDTKELRIIRDTFVKGGLRLLVPSIMERELLRHFGRRAKEVANRVANAHGEYPFRKLGVPLPSKTEIEERCFRELEREWETFKAHFAVEALPLTARIENVLEWYFSVAPPFSDKKPKEFPDAFILSALEEYFQKHSVRIAVISADGDFTSACELRREISRFKALQEFMEAFQPELTKSGIGEPIDPTKPITTEDLTEMKSILRRGEGATSIERNRVVKLISTRGSNYDYFFQNANDAFWLDPLIAEGYFSTVPATEKLESGQVVTPQWLPIDYLVRVYKKAPDAVIAVLESLPETDNVRILDGFMEIILISDRPDLIRKFYRRIQAYIGW